MEQGDDEMKRDDLDCITFESVAPEFTKFYQEFDTALRQTPFEISNCSDQCFVTFGISGAGKVGCAVLFSLGNILTDTYGMMQQSTLIARLISNMSSDEFYGTIQNRPAERCTIKDITIGHSFNSTTVVPKIYCIRGLHLCDMPGFAEVSAIWVSDRRTPFSKIFHITPG